MPRCHPFGTRTALAAIATTLCAFTSLLAAEPTVTKLWPTTPPGPQAFADGPEYDRQRPTDRHVGGGTVMKWTNVAEPELHVFLPPPEKANGAACVICPGGGFHILAWDLEGTEVARWLNDHGIAAILLKYRTPTGKHGKDDRWKGPVMDAQRALSLARANAKTWHLDPDRIGILGFSAGGKTAANTALFAGKRLYEPIDDADSESCAANFAILVYPAWLTDDQGKLLKDYRVDKNTPPIFFAHAADDPITCESSAELFLALKRAKVPSELHVYPTGGHGYGLRPDWHRVTRWPRDAAAWLHDQGMLEPVAKASDHKGSPVDHLPPYVRRLTHFGKRPHWSADGKRILFVEKPRGEVFAFDRDTGSIRPITLAFNHHGFSKAITLADGNILLLGPSHPASGSDENSTATNDLFLLEKSVTKPPVPLGLRGVESVAASPDSMTIAWTEQPVLTTDGRETPPKLYMANVEFSDDAPRLTERHLAFDGASPSSIHPDSLEVAGFVAPDDQRLLVSADVDGHREALLLDTKTGELRNLTRSEKRVDTPVAVFPDGREALVASAAVVDDVPGGTDLHKLALDERGSMQRLTDAATYPGYAASEGVLSPDGRFLCFAIDKADGERSTGQGLFVMNLPLAEKSLDAPRTYSTKPHPDDDVTKRIATAWKKREPLPRISDASSSGGDALNQAYRVQRRWLQQTLDAKEIGGVKGGLVSPRVQARLGISEPLGGILRKSGRRDGTKKSTIALADWPGLKIETEIAFIIGKPITRRLTTGEEFKAHVRAVAPAIELPAGQLAGDGPPTAADIAAINIGAAAYLVGKEVKPDTLDPRAVKVTLTRDGESLHTGSGDDCWKGPWETGLWLANFAFDQGIDLKPGQVILSGALGKMHPGQPGRYVANFGDLGTIEFTLK
ncbi:Acetylxylan esterase precursor [Planctomycetes bacterium Pan216]|uniref:Acetylxylan esterase n=1 Tax=Kolteria novifilia TaxID=2527975 RepID=A0A518B047_9BACT|nr:Acetylxylan esterase precursor [Planctomycetes bacterium Pan216]